MSARIHTPTPALGVRILVLTRRTRASGAAGRPPPCSLPHESTRLIGVIRVLLTIREIRVPFCDP